MLWSIVMGQQLEPITVLQWENVHLALSEKKNFSSNLFFF